MNLYEWFGVLNSGSLALALIAGIGGVAYVRWRRQDMNRIMMWLGVISLLMVAGVQTVSLGLDFVASLHAQSDGSPLPHAQFSSGVVLGLYAVGAGLLWLYISFRTVWEEEEILVMAAMLVLLGCAFTNILLYYCAGYEQWVVPFLELYLVVPLAVMVFELVQLRRDHRRETPSES
jgi:hypothetical protein